MYLTFIAATALADGSSGTLKIANVTVDTSDQVMQATGSQTWSNPDSCATSSFVVIQDSAANPYFKDMVAAVMAAAAAGDTVSFWLHGCVSSPWGVAPLATSVTVNYP